MIKQYIIGEACADNVRVTKYIDGEVEDFKILSYCEADGYCAALELEGYTRAYSITENAIHLNTANEVKSTPNVGMTGNNEFEIIDQVCIDNKGWVILRCWNTYVVTSICNEGYSDGYLSYVTITEHRIFNSLDEAREYYSMIKDRNRELTLVRCTNIRKSMPTQIKVGKLYWVRESSKYVDEFGNMYASVYKDYKGECFVGNLSMKHFENDYQYVKHGMSISTYINDNKGLLLGDIISYCERAESASSFVNNILKYIKDNQLDKPELMKQEFLIKCMSAKECLTAEQISDYKTYCGYSVVPNV